MLLPPNNRLHEQALTEVGQDYHPAIMPSAGPEQDYLSRFFAPFWTNISVNYNYQIHQIFYSLQQVLSWWHKWPDTRNLPARLKIPLGKQP